VNSPYPPGNNSKAPWLDDDSKLTQWQGDEINDCRRCHCEAMVDENGICEACFEPEELTEIDYLDE